MKIKAKSYARFAKLFIYLFIFIIFFIASETHTEKKKKLHRTNKVIKRKKNSEFTHLHGITYKY